MLHDLANDGGFVALKSAAEDRDKNLLYSRRLLMMTLDPDNHISPSTPTPC